MRMGFLVILKINNFSVSKCIKKFFCTTEIFETLKIIKSWTIISETGKRVFYEVVFYEVGCGCVFIGAGSTDKQTQ
jgi:hypothetical protein